MFTTIVVPELCEVQNICSDLEDDNSDYEEIEEYETRAHENYHNNARNFNVTSIIENERNQHFEENDASSSSVSRTELSDEVHTLSLSPNSNEMEINRQDEEQTINELVETTAANNGELVEMQNNSHMRVAFGIILRLVLPFANGVARRIQGIGDVRFLRVLQGIASSRQALANLLAFAANTISMNLSSVQVSHRIEPILKLMKIRKSRDGLESLPDNLCSNGLSSTTPSTPPTPSTAGCTPISNSFYFPLLRNPKGSTLPNFGVNQLKASVLKEPAPKCCNLKILTEPPPGQTIRADIVFIHGLHGSLVNTWKQGLWENERRPVEFNRPPKPPIRPPKRARHSRSTHIRPPHKQKRARMTHLEEFFRQPKDIDAHEERNDITYICGEPQDIKVCDGVEYSFPNLRIRTNDSSRLVQPELKTTSCISEQDSTDNNQLDVAIQKGDEKPTKQKAKQKPKMTPNDPNYSKCWPGDWLPLDCPCVRVIAVNYTTDQHLWRPLWKKKEPRTNLIQRAREMAELLIEQRVGHGHPIIWVGHSKGGLFVKQIIVDAWESGRPAMEPFWRSARGCFFYSVPHRGSHLASIKVPLLTRSVELLDIEKNSKYLLDLHRRFAGLYHLGHLQIEVFSFVETALTLMSVLYLRIVGVDSADPGIGDVCGIRLDHREICKPRNRDCILYKELVKMIKKVC